VTVPETVLALGSVIAAMIILVLVTEPAIVTFVCYMFACVKRWFEEE